MYIRSSNLREEILSVFKQYVARKHQIKLAIHYIYLNIYTYVCFNINEVSPAGAPRRFGGSAPPLGTRVS